MNKYYVTYIVNPTELAVSSQITYLHSTQKESEHLLYINYIIY